MILTVNNNKSFEILEMKTKKYKNEDKHKLEFVAMNLDTKERFICKRNLKNFKLDEDISFYVKNFVENILSLS